MQFMACHASCAFAQLTLLRSMSIPGRLQLDLCAAFLYLGCRVCREAVSKPQGFCSKLKMMGRTALPVLLRQMLPQQTSRKTWWTCQMAGSQHNSHKGTAKESTHCLQQSKLVLIAIGCLPVIDAIHIHLVIKLELHVRTSLQFKSFPCTPYDGLPTSCSHSQASDRHSTKATTCFSCKAVACYQHMPGVRCHIFC